MKYISSKNSNEVFSLSQALSKGLASDGGLFIPESLPLIKTKGLEKLEFPQLAHKVLSPFFKGDKLNKNLKEICEQSFNFPVSIKKLKDNTNVLELFHGPTAAFKDFGARFLAECLNHLNQKKTILVATSGDTGGAVASAFYQKKNINVAILFPKEGVSKEQFNQLTCWGDNILSIAIDGTFDDCQKAVKKIFIKNELENLTSANSINIGRVLAQITYYAYASLKGNENFIIPSGNIGNALGCFWAKEMGFPIKEIILSTNSNKAIDHFSKTGRIKAFPTRKTVANAMDVGNPSNLERLKILNKKPETFMVEDSEILETIQSTLLSHTYLICPHTATAFFARKKLAQEKKYTLVATAAPKKFKTIILKNFPDLEECFTESNFLEEKFKTSSKNIKEISNLIKNSF